MKNERIVHYTTTELEALAARGEAGSDWGRAALRPVPHGDDPDDAIEPFAMADVTAKRPDLGASISAESVIDADLLD